MLPAEFIRHRGGGRNGLFFGSRFRARAERDLAICDGLIDLPAFRQRESQRQTLWCMQNDILPQTSSGTSEISAAAGGEAPIPDDAAVAECRRGLSCVSWPRCLMALATVLSAIVNSVACEDPFTSWSVGKAPWRRVMVVFKSRAPWPNIQYTGQHVRKMQWRGLLPNLSTHCKDPLDFGSKLWRFF